MFKNIAKNFISLITAQVIYKILSFIAIAYVARNIGDVKFGQVSLALYLGALFFAIADMGLSEVYICEAAGRQDREKELIGPNAGSRFALSVAASFLIPCLAFLFTRNFNVIVLIIFVGLSMILDSFTLFLRSIFRARERMEYEAVSFILEALIKFIALVLIIIFLKDNLIFLGMAFFITSIIVLVFTAMLCFRKGIMIRPVVKIKALLDLVKKGLPFAIVGFFCVINLKIDVIMLSKLTNDATTGWYSAGVRLIESILIVPATVAIIFFPVISRLYNGSAEVFMKAYRKFFITCLVFGALMTVFLYTGADLLIYCIFGKGFVKSILIVKFLSFIFVPFFLKFYLEKVAFVAQKQMVLFIAYLGGLIIKVILNLIFIPLFSYKGAGLSTLITEGLIVAYVLLNLKISPGLLKSSNEKKRFSSEAPLFY